LAIVSVLCRFRRTGRIHKRPGQMIRCLETGALAIRSPVAAYDLETLVDVIVIGL
jgi:hypothetical protein